MALQYEKLEVPTDHFIICDSKLISPEAASELAAQVNRFVILVPGGKAGIDTMDMAALRSVLEFAEKKQNEIV